MEKSVTMLMMTKGEEKMRINPFQLGVVIILGWVIVLVSTFLQPIFGEGMLWFSPLLGAGFIVLGFILFLKVMKPLKIDATFNTPRIDMDQGKGLLLIQGRSIPENPGQFYELIFEWLKEYSFPV